MIEVLTAGYFTSLQDGGRVGYRHLGVPVSGAMDSKAYATAIALLPFQNDKCVFECTLLGPSFLFHQALRFVLTGGEMEAWLDDRPIEINRVYLAKSGSQLRLGKSKQGIRTYVRFEAELAVVKPLGSAAYFHPITPKIQLNDGDIFKLINQPQYPVENPVHLKIDNHYLLENILQVTPGPDWYQLNKDQQQHILEEKYPILSHNRMGYRLSGTTKIDAGTLFSQLVLPGMIQLTPGGELLIATADCQVTGGYLQILQLTPHSLACLVQKREGENLTFQNRLD